LFGKLVRKPFIVIVEKCDVVTRRIHDAAVARCCPTVPSLVADKSNPIIMEAGHNVRSIVIGCIIDNYDFEILEGLVKYTINSAAQQLSSVMGRNNDYDSWHFFANLSVLVLKNNPLPLFNA